MHTAKYSDFEVSVLHLPEDATNWNLVYDFLGLRRKVFIEKMNWQLTDSNGIEFEQYDIVGLASYVIAHSGSKVIAGARIIRCDKAMGRYSYMIRDAYLGKIDLPSNLCDQPPPIDPLSWELTRLVSEHKNPAVAKAVLDVANDYIYQHDGLRCLFLGPPGFLKMARAYGYHAEKLGAITSNESGRFLAFQCKAINRPERALIRV